MADPLLRVKRSRGFSSLIKGEQLDNFMRDALKKDFVPFVDKEFRKVSDRFGEHGRKDSAKIKWDINVQVGPKRGQVMTIRPTGAKWAVARWYMIDTKGREFKKDAIKSTKFKIVRRKSGVTIFKGGQGIGKQSGEKGGTYKRPIPMPIRDYEGHSNSRGAFQVSAGSGTYDEDNVVFRTKANLGAVTPAYITRDHIAPVVRKEMTRVVENAYRRAFLKITGKGI